MNYSVVSLHPKNWFFPVVSVVDNSRDSSLYVCSTCMYLKITAFIGTFMIIFKKKKTYSGLKFFTQKNKNKILNLREETTNAHVKFMLCISTHELVHHVGILKNAFKQLYNKSVLSFNF